MHAIARQRRRLLITLLVLAGLVCLSAPFSGMNWLNPTTLWSPFAESLDAEIFWRIRLPRVLLAFLTGSGLALCGLVFQAMFRNPLATPYTLGVSSGASLGAVIYLHTGLAFSLLGIAGLSIAAFVGAVFSILLVFALTRGAGGFSSSVMLLAGVAISFFFSSLILFMQYLSDFTGSVRIMRWLMGGLETVGMQPVLQILPFVGVGTAVILFLSNELNLLSIGEELAVSRGVDLKRTKRLLFFATSLVVGGIVSVCGPIGFVGMIAPHCCRLLIGPDHKYLTPATILFGGMFLTVCDLIARVLIAPTEIPVGVITALLGGPFFLWLLLRGLADKSIWGT